MPINNLSLPTTNVWDPSVLQDIDINSPEFKELLVRLYQNIGVIALTVNRKDSGVYDTLDEFITSQQYFPNPLYNSLTTTQPEFRDVIRKVINFGALPVATKSVNHDIAITPQTTFTRIYATASDTTNNVYIPIPYASATPGTEVELFVDATQVTINTASDRSSFNVTYVILEYLQT